MKKELYLSPEMTIVKVALGGVLLALSGGLSAGIVNNDDSSSDSEDSWWN